MNIISIIGTKPEIIKMAPLIPLLDKTFNYKIIYTGQHYNYELTEIFFKELKLRKPDYKLDAYSFKYAGVECFKQAFTMVNEIKEVIKKAKPELCIVLGDANSAFAKFKQNQYKGNHKNAVINGEASLKHP